MSLMSARLDAETGLQNPTTVTVLEAQAADPTLMTLGP